MKNAKREKSALLKFPDFPNKNHRPPIVEVVFSLFPASNLRSVFLSFSAGDRADGFPMSSLELPVKFSSDSSIVFSIGCSPCSSSVPEDLTSFSEGLGTDSGDAPLPFVMIYDTTRTGS